MIARNKDICHVFEQGHMAQPALFQTKAYVRICHIYMLKETMAKRNSYEYSIKDNGEEKRSFYETSNDGSHLLCRIDEIFRSKYVESFCYCSEIDFIAAMNTSWGNMISTKGEAKDNSTIKELFKSDSDNLIIRTDNMEAGILLASILFHDEWIDYLISPYASETIYKIREKVSDTAKADILIRYLAAFNIKCTAIVALDSCEALPLLLSCSNARCIAIVPPTYSIQLPADVPILEMKHLEGCMTEHDNDSFKKLLMKVIDDYMLQVNDFIYAYLINNIDSTDRLETIQSIAGRIRRLPEIEREYGTSILRNACSDTSSYEGHIAIGGASPSDSENLLKIIEYLISLGLGYEHKPYNDMAKMAIDLHDSQHLPIIFRALIENGCYYLTAEDIFSFLEEFISLAMCNDSIIPIDDSGSPSYFQRLDSARCGQFRIISPYIPSEVFKMRDADGDTLLIIAARELEDLPALFKMILDRTPNIDAINEDGCTALHYISDYRRWDALVKAGADISIKDNEGNIPSPKFCMDHLEEFLQQPDKDKEFASRLLFNVIDASYSSSLIYENEDAIMQLINIINPDTRKADDGYTPLMEILIQEGYFPEIYDRMIDVGVDINAVNKAGYSTLDIVVLSPECTIAKIRYLLSKGADGSHRSTHGTAATLAAGLFHIKSTEWNALWTIQDKSIFTYHTDRIMSPIMVALYYQNMDAVRFLFSHNAIPDDEKYIIKERIMTIKSDDIRSEAYGLYSVYFETPM